jgi:hypothetical protein
LVTPPTAFGEVLAERPNPAEASAAVVEASTLIDWMLPLLTQLIVRVRGPISRGWRPPLTLVAQ